MKEYIYQNVLYVGAQIYELLPSLPLILPTQHLWYFELQRLIKKKCVHRHLSFYMEQWFRKILHVAKKNNNVTRP